MLYLNVPYSEKDIAKNMGAKWNPKERKWYITKYRDYAKFYDWFPYDGGTIILNNIYLLVGQHHCFKCKKTTRVISFGIKNYLYIDDDYTEIYLNEKIKIAGIIDPIPPKILTYITNKYNFKKRYSQTTGLNEYNNCCDNCDTLQGRYFLYQEVESPFFITSENDLKNLEVYSFPLENDFITTCQTLELDPEHDFYNIKEIVL